MLASRLATRIAFACAAPLVLSSMAWSAPALAQGAPTGFERAILAQLNASTRASVEQRATGGNTVTNVVGTILLNNYQAGAENPGTPLTVVAVDFARGVVVLRRDPNTWELVRFDPQTLRIMR